jgi:hypothetical protein
MDIGRFVFSTSCGRLREGYLPHFGEKPFVLRNQQRQFFLFRSEFFFRNLNFD